MVQIINRGHEMVCTVRIYEKPVLNDPVLIEGLPGIGFVANMATLHLIKELKAKLFGEIHSSYFQDFAVTIEDGKARYPVNEFYYYKGKGDERDLILLYGNTQALTTRGQYELCGRILDVAEELGCRYVLTLGGLKREEDVETHKIYCAASDIETLRDAAGFGTELSGGQIFGAAGLLVGLSGLRGMKGLSLLAETPGYLDVTATREMLDVMCRMLHLKVDLDKLDETAQTTSNIMESFGLVTRSEKEEKSEKESRPHGVI